MTMKILQHDLCIFTLMLLFCMFTLDVKDVECRLLICYLSI